MLHVIKALLDIPKKHKYVKNHNYYRNMAGGWCSSHGALMLRRHDYYRFTYEEMVEFVES